VSNTLSGTRPKRSQGRTANFAVLARSDNLHFKLIFALSERFDDWREFNRFGARPVDNVAA